MRHGIKIKPLPKAPGKPGPDAGFQDPESGENWISNPNGKGFE